jgi:hypothetical protein
MFIKAIEDPKTVMIPINQMRGQGIECDSKDSIDKVVASHHPKLLSLQDLIYTRIVIVALSMAWSIILVTMTLMV